MTTEGPKAVKEAISFLESAKSLEPLVKSK